MSWESRKTLIKTKSIKESINYNVAEHLGAPGKPIFTCYYYVIEVHSSETNELLYRVLMEPDGTWKHAKMFCDAWDNPGVFNFELFDEYFPKIKKSNIKTNTALFRIKEPYQLSDSARGMYLKHLQRNATAIVKDFIDNNSKSFELILNCGLLKKNNIDELVKYANAKNNTEWTAFLLDWKSKNTSGKKGTPKLTVQSHLVGDEIVLGHYKWGDDDVPMEWVIVDATKKQYLLLSKYLVKEMPFYSGKREKYQHIGWSKSDVRKWLNNEFFSTSFDIGERERICQKNLKNINDDDTEDYLFIPSEKEFQKYVELPELVEEKLQFRYGSNRALGDTEMLRKTWKRYSSYCIELRTSDIWSHTNKPAYIHQYGDVTSPYYIRPMMWVSKE